MKINVESWNTASEWSWLVREGDDVCGICHSAYENSCPKCKMPGDECPLMWGQCSHVFHLHCIEDWFKTQVNGRTCPMDRQPWHTQRAA